MRLTTFIALATLTALVGCNSGGSGNNNGGSGVLGLAPAGVGAVSSAPSESGTIQISQDDRFVYVLNRTAQSLTIVSVVDSTGADDETVVAELPVGNDPRSVSVSADAARAYVSNGADGTVTVLDLVALEVSSKITVGAEPRGTALSPSGALLYVANSSDGTLSVIDTQAGSVTSTVALGIRTPWAVTVTSDGDGQDDDETIYVSDFFARARPGKAVDEIEGFDDGKEGRVAVVSAGTNAVSSVLALSPMASGFSADRTAFDTANGAANDTFKSAAADPTKDPQESFFNQLHAISVDPATGKLYVNATGASPEPPVKFNVNVQALVGVIDPATNTEVASEHVNLNDAIKVETQPATIAGSLVRAFAADTVDVAIRAGVALFVSRGGSYVLRAGFDGQGRLTLNNGASTSAVRIATGSIPTGVVMNQAGTRAYVNAEVDQTLTRIDLSTNATIGSALSTADLPAEGSVEHNALIGKLVFFTGMGTPANGLVGKSVRSIDTHTFRGRASDNNWSSCASCHPDGLSDNVTWIFPTGPRQTPPLDASYSAADPQKQRVFNWNAVRGSVTDFNNNSRNVQGGVGFTPNGDADAGQVFNHGPNAGVSEALDLNTLWVQVGIRTPNAPSTLDAAKVARGRTAFQALNCNSCHGTEQWTSSRVNWDYPLFPSNPLAPGGATPFDPRVKQAGAGPVLLAFDADADTLFDDNGDGFDDTPVVTRFDVGAAPASPTLDTTNPIEIRGGGGAIGKGPVGGLGSFNPPSLLGLRNSAPYGHHGRAQSVTQVFDALTAGGLGHPTFGASAQQLDDLAEFLRSIDATTTPIN